MKRKGTKVHPINSPADADAFGEAADGRIRRIEDLDDIFAGDLEPPRYLRKPELPEKATIVLGGLTEAGKTTLGSAWARDLCRQGHHVLLIDRDSNPRERIRDRFNRLGVTAADPRPIVWDSQQVEEPPRCPDDSRVVEWTKRAAATGKLPLVILDSLIGFFGADADENNSADMRRFFDRCRILNQAGGTVLVFHHANREGRLRGSSDLEPAIDQGFTVTNVNRGGGRLLDQITLRPFKSRYGLSDPIRYLYNDGAMMRDERPLVNERVQAEDLTSLLRSYPGITQDRFEKLALSKDLTRAAARQFLQDGVLAGTIRQHKLKTGRGATYTPEASA